MERESYGDNEEQSQQLPDDDQSSQNLLGSEEVDQEKPIKKLEQGDHSEAIAFLFQDMVNNKIDVPELKAYIESSKRFQTALKEANLSLDQMKAYVRWFEHKIDVFTN
jgi:hypothetical protein